MNTKIFVSLTLGLGNYILCRMPNFETKAKQQSTFEQKDISTLSQTI